MPIYLTLDAMRALERWGAYTMEQAVEGAKLALPPPEGMERLNLAIEAARKELSA